MHISWNWLRQHVDLDGLDAVETARRFTITTAEIEDVRLPPDPSRLSAIKIARVEWVGPHPNADKLRCVKVECGGEVLDIVCGAANVRPGLTTLLAPVGCKIGDMEIKAAKIRGVPSHGMLCSPKEAGVGDDDSGIAELPGLPTGLPASELFKDHGPVWDLDNKAVTHRPDLWGHYGIARELAAILQKPLADLELADFSGTSGHDGYTVEIENPALCRRYCGVSLTGIKVGPSPDWMRALLEQVGQKPINNVVDATNFVMLELGQPTHAFDARQLREKKMRVANAKGGETFTTLTGRELTLGKDNLLIQCAGRAVALAGIMGGAQSSVQEDTTEVFLEAAHFAPVCVRKTAQAFDLRTDSAARFEKSLDPENAPLALRRIVHLLRETCPGLALRSGLVDCYPAPIAKRVIDLDSAFVRRKMGMDIHSAWQKAILQRLGFIVEGADPWRVHVPSYRNTKDIEDPIDLVEEIGRIHGLDKIIPCSPNLELRPVRLSAEIQNTRAIKALLADRGYGELKTYSFVNLEEMQALGLDASRCMALKNPNSKEQTHMRTTILPRAVEAWTHNAKHLESFNVFELGKVFKTTSNLLPDETDELVCARYAVETNGDGLHRLAADLRDILSLLGCSAAQLVQDGKAMPIAHPARTARIVLDGVELGYIAEFHPSLAKRQQMTHRLSFFVLYNPLGVARTMRVKFTAPDRFPAVPFSVSFLVPERTAVGEVLSKVQAIAPQDIHDLQWKENYSGGSIPAGKVSMTLAMNFKFPDRTMKGEEIQALQDKIIKAAATHGYLLRTN